MQTTTPNNPRNTLHTQIPAEQLIYHPPIITTHSLTHSKQGSRLTRDTGIRSILTTKPPKNLIASHARDKLGVGSLFMSECDLGELQTLLHMRRTPETHQRSKRF